MSIVLRKAELQTLDEKSLRTQVLIPLFVAMGFKDVKETHGNIEFGRDIVMWKEDPLAERVNYAVVVKSQRVSSGRLLNEVVGQVQECFAKHYTDPISNKSARTDAVLLVLQKGLTLNAQESLSRRLEVQGFRFEVKTWDSEELYIKCRQYLNPKTIWGRIDDLVQLLNSKSKYFDFTLQVASTGDRSLFLSRKASGPLEIEHSFSFSDDESGVAAREDYDRFLKSGMPLTVGAESISATSLPEEVASLFGDLSLSRIYLGPARLEKPLSVRLDLLANNQLLWSSGFIQFTHRRSTEKEDFLENLGQGNGIILSFGITERPQFSSIQLRFRESGEISASEMLGLALANRALRECTHFRMYDYYTDAIVAVGEFGSVEGRQIPNIPQEDLEIYALLAAIQHNIRAPVLLERGLIPEDQAEVIYLVGTILRDGILKTDVATITLGLDLAEGSPELRVGQEILLQRIEENFSREVMGHQVNLGPVICRFEGIVEPNVDPSSKERYPFLVRASAEKPFYFVVPARAHLLPKLEPSTEDKNPET